MALIEPKKIPTSVGGLKAAGKEVVGTGVGAIMLVAGLGVGVLALPYLARVPFVNRALAAGVGTVMPASKQNDGFGGF